MAMEEQEKEEEEEEEERVKVEGSINSLSLGKLGYQRENEEKQRKQLCSLLTETIRDSV